MRAGSSQVALFGGAGADQMFANSSGFYQLDGGAGADTFDGTGASVNVVYYSATTGITVDMGNPSLSKGDAEGDTFINIAGIEGSSFSDTITGDANNNVLIGWEGNDFLDGGDGDDSFLADNGADAYHGGDGFDTLSYDVGWITGGLTTGLASATGAATGDFADGTVEMVVGTKFADRMNGGGFGTFVDGNDGNDYLTSFGAVMIGGAGADKIEGSFTFDTASYQTSTMNLTIDLNQTLQHGGDAEGDQLINIESVTGGSGNDRLIGRTIQNGETLNGGAGDDHLTGGGFLIGGAGADLMENNGQFGAIVSYETATAGVRVDMTNMASNTNDAAGDSFVGRDNGNHPEGVAEIRGSAFDDILISDGTLLNLGGGDGDDELHNGYWLDGGAGADVLEGTINGGVANYGGSSIGITVNMLNTAQNTGDAAGDTYSNITGLWGSEHGDVLTANNTDGFGLTGNGGDDILTGGTGINALNGGTGHDTLFGGAGNDTFVLNSKDDGLDEWQDFVSGTDAVIVGGFGFNLTVAARAPDDPNDPNDNSPAAWAGAAFLNTDYFVEGSAATVNHAQFVFDTSVAGHHTLYFDADGTGSGAKTALADLLNANLHVSDIGIFV
jgi:Ca2+-binding RTX toxin-like protein